MKVSCVMPTFNRREFIRSAVECYQKQTHADRELIVLDDGDDKIADCLPDDPSIKYLTCEKKTLGEKLNICNEAATGDIICHFDDDDWHAPTRIEKQVERLAGYSLTGFSDIRYLDTRTGAFYRWRKPQRIYGCSLSYYRETWRAVKFPHLRRGTDNPFISSVDLFAGGHDVCPDPGYIVGRIHQWNLTDWVASRLLVPCDRGDIPAEFIAAEEARTCHSKR